MRWWRVAVCIVCALCLACSGSTRSIAAGDRSVCTSWVAAATAVNRGSSGSPLTTSADHPDLSSLLTDPAYAPSFQAVAASAPSAVDPTVRGAAATLSTSLQASANHGAVDVTALRDAMAMLTSRCLQLGFAIRPMSSG